MPYSSEVNCIMQSMLTVLKGQSGPIPATRGWPLAPLKGRARAPSGRAWRICCAAAVMRVDLLRLLLPGGVVCLCWVPSIRMPRLKVVALFFSFFTTLPVRTALQEWAVTGH